jgi:hypothetical protein
MKLKKLLIKTLITFVIICILIYKLNKPEKDDGIKVELRLFDHKPENSIKKDDNNKIEEIKKERRIHYEPNNTYWEKLEPLMYFKRSLGYYFIDKQLGRLMFATHFEQNNFNLSIELNIYKNDDLILKDQIETIRIEIESFRDAHLRYHSIYFDFETDSLDKERDDFINNLRDYTMEIFIKNNKNNQTTQSPIELKIKNLRKAKNDPKIEYGMVCSKCLTFADDLYASSLKWWFELHRQIGYSKLRFCNNSIPNTPAYNDVFYE